MKDDGELAQQLLRDARTIAVVGISSDPSKASHGVARYLIDAGYDVYLVNPAEREVFGQPVYQRLQDVPVEIDIVDVFRRVEFLPEVFADAIAVGAKAVWTQLELVDEDAAARARDAGLAVVMDRCTKIEHRRLPRGDFRSS
jgi:predicted CoA-binding protein